MKTVNNSVNIHMKNLVENPVENPVKISAENSVKTTENHRISLHAFGVRGSFPVSGAQFRNFGGGTSCFMLKDETTTLLLDAGSGTANIPADLLTGRELHILLSHVHMDHISGVMNLTALYEAGKVIHIYGAARNGKSIEEQLNQIYCPPYWPVKLGQLASEVHFHDIREGEPFQIGGFTVNACRSNHPDQCFSFRITEGEKAVGYALDCELTEENEKSWTSFFRNCDLVVFDGTYLPGKNIPGWGHSTWLDGVRVMREGRIEKMLISHFSPQSTDRVLEEEEKKASAMEPGCIFAREGMTLQL